MSFGYFFDNERDCIKSNPESKYKTWSIKNKLNWLVFFVSKSRYLGKFNFLNTSITTRKALFL